MTANQAREIRNKTYEDAFIGIENDPQYIAVMKAIDDAVKAKPLPKDEIDFIFEPKSDSTTIVVEKLTKDGYCVFEPYYHNTGHYNISW